MIHSGLQICKRYWNHQLIIDGTQNCRVICTQSQNLYAVEEIYYFIQIRNRKTIILFFKSYYLPAYPRYAPSEYSEYLYCWADPTINLSYSAYVVFPSQSAKSTRSRWRVSDVIKWRLSLPTHISNTCIITQCDLTYVIAKYFLFSLFYQRFLQDHQTDLNQTFHADGIENVVVTFLKIFGGQFGVNVTFWWEPPKFIVAASEWTF